MRKTVAVAVMLIFLRPAAAQENQGESANPANGQEGAAKISVRVENVILQVTISEKGNGSSLKKENFRIKTCPSSGIFNVWEKIKGEEENNCSIEKVIADEKLHERPLRGLILVDTSGSTNPRIDAFTKKAVMELMKTVGLAGDKFSLWEFTKHTRKVVDWTDDQQRIGSELAELKAGGQTAIFDALYVSAQEMKKFPPSFTKIIFLMSDMFNTEQSPLIDPLTGNICPEEKRIIGNYSPDACRSVTLSDVAATLQESGILLYVIDFSKGFMKPANAISYGTTMLVKPLSSPEDIEKIALASGGQRFWVSNTKEAVKAFEKIGGVVNTMHILWFSPTVKEPGWYDVVVEIGAVNDKEEFKVNKKFKFNKNFFHKGRYKIE